MDITIFAISMIAIFPFLLDGAIPMPRRKDRERKIDRNNDRSAAEGILIGMFLGAIAWAVILLPFFL